MQNFDSFGLSRPLLSSLARMGFSQPTPVQQESLPIILQGKDVIAQAQTGTGKTAAFGIPMIERLDGRPGAPVGLIIVPTRELAIQVASELKNLGAGKRAVVRPIYGGQAISTQSGYLKAGSHIVVGTPGRLLDHLRRRTLSLGQVATVVLDEADRMLDMGFINDIESILAAVPKVRQTLLFSATIPAQILPLANRHLREPVTVKVAPDRIMAKGITHTFYAVESHRRLDTLCDLLREETAGQTLVFCQTKREVDRVVIDLRREGLSVCGLHGGYTQRERDETMGRVRQGKVTVLVATDIAARGLDIEDIGRVVNYRLPVDPTSYIHRAGRTARAGRTGVAASLVSPSERPLLTEIGRHSRIPVDLCTISGAPVAQPMTPMMPARVGRRSFGPGGRGCRPSTRNVTRSAS
ncbi:MAG: DEAD/DEAH box helicase [Pseudomonadota bacterium]